MVEVVFVVEVEVGVVVEVVVVVVVEVVLILSLTLRIMNETNATTLAETEFNRDLRPDAQAFAEIRIITVLFPPSQND